MVEEKWLSLAIVAQLIGVSTQYLRNEINDPVHPLPHKRDGKLFLVRAQEAYEHLKRHASPRVPTGLRPPNAADDPRCAAGLELLAILAKHRMLPAKVEAAFNECEQARKKIAIATAATSSNANESESESWVSVQTCAQLMKVPPVWLQRWISGQMRPGRALPFRIVDGRPHVQPCAAYRHILEWSAPGEAIAIDPALELARQAAAIASAATTTAEVQTSAILSWPEPDDGVFESAGGHQLRDQDAPLDAAAADGPRPASVPA